MKQFLLTLCFPFFCILYIHKTLALVLPRRLLSWMYIPGLSQKSGEDKERGADESMKTAIAEKEPLTLTAFIAQEAEAAAKELNFFLSDVDKLYSQYGVCGPRYARFVMPLVRAIRGHWQ